MEGLIKDSTAALNVAALSEAQEHIRNAQRILTELRGNVNPPHARELSIAITALEDSSMRVNRAFYGSR